MAFKPTKAQAEEIIEMFDDGKDLSEVIALFRKKVKCSPSGIHAFIANSIFLSAEKRTKEHQMVRDKLLDVLLAESVLKQALRAASETKESRKIKVRRLVNLSKAEEKLLEKQGYVDFVEELDDAGVTLDIEETKETILPDKKILEKLLGLVEGTVSVEDIAKEITPFSDPDPATPEV